MGGVRAGRRGVMGGGREGDSLNIITNLNYREEIRLLRRENIKTLPPTCPPSLSLSPSIPHTSPPSYPSQVPSPHCFPPFSSLPLLSSLHFVHSLLLNHFNFSSTLSFSHFFMLYIFCFFPSFVLRLICSSIFSLSSFRENVEERYLF